MDPVSMITVCDRWWSDVWRDGDLDACDEILGDPFVRHTALGTVVGSRDDYKARLAESQRTLWRPQTAVDARTVSGSTVWTRATSRGVNRETGDLAVVTWMLAQRLVDGRIVEHWSLTGRDIDWTS